MNYYTRIKENDDNKYPRSLAEALLKLKVPTIYLGDLIESRRATYSEVVNMIKKDNRVILNLGEDIAESIADKYFNDKLKDGNWMYENGVFFAYNKNIIIVLDFISTKESVICLE